MNQTKQALEALGVAALTARKALVWGKGPADYRMLQGAEEGHVEAIAQLGGDPKLVPKRLLTIIVPDAEVPPVVDIVHIVHGPIGCSFYAWLSRRNLVRPPESTQNFLAYCFSTDLQETRSSSAASRSCGPPFRKPTSCSIPRRSPSTPLAQWD